MNKSLKKIIILCGIPSFLGISFWLRDIIADRKNVIEVMSPITLLEKAPQDYPKTNREMGKIEIGEDVKVLRIGYGKDFRAWQVRGSAGQEGWFIEDNENIKIKKLPPN